MDHLPRFEVLPRPPPWTTLLTLPVSLIRRGISVQINRATSVEARRKLIVDGLKLKQDWLDAEHWRALAKNRRYRLPHWYIPLSTSKMESVLHDLGLDIDFYREAFGLVSYRDFITRNPSTPLWVFAGLCLELSET